MADLLSIGASGVKTYQTALATVSENIANVGNGAYARRSTNVTELAPVQGGLSAAAAMTGYGSIATGINRASDMFKSAAVRDSGADLARTQAGTVWLNSIQSALTGSDLSTSLTNFFNAAQSVAADPASPTPRAAISARRQRVFMIREGHRSHHRKGIAHRRQAPPVHDPCSAVTAHLPSRARVRETSASTNRAASAAGDNSSSDRLASRLGRNRSASSIRAMANCPGAMRAVAELGWMVAA